MTLFGRSLEGRVLRSPAGCSSLGRRHDDGTSGQIQGDVDVRVLATFPELFEPGPDIGGPMVNVERACEAEARPASAGVEAGKPRLPAAGARENRPAAQPRPRQPRPIRTPHRARFPTGSIVALAVVTAVVWTLVALRERAEPDRLRSDIRLAAESATSGDMEARR
jgi:hypothetical protein